MTCCNNRPDQPPPDRLARAIVAEVLDLQRDAGELAAQARLLDQAEGLSTLRAARLLLAVSAAHDALAAELEGLSPLVEDLPAEHQHDAAGGADER